MDNETKRIPRNMGRIEFIACRETIQDLVERGYDNKKIHAELARCNRISMSYSAFCVYMARLRKHDEMLQQSSARPPAETQAVRDLPPMSRPTSRPQQFTINPSPRKEDLF